MWDEGRPRREGCVIVYLMVLYMKQGGQVPGGLSAIVFLFSGVSLAQ